jgi:hypothetical protein
VTEIFPFDNGTGRAFIGMTRTVSFAPVLPAGTTSRAERTQPLLDGLAT